MFIRPEAPGDVFKALLFMAFAALAAPTYALEHGEKRIVAFSLSAIAFIGLAAVGIGLWSGLRGLPLLGIMTIAGCDGCAMRLIAQLMTRRY